MPPITTSITYKTKHFSRGKAKAQPATKTRDLQCTLLAPPDFILDRFPGDDFRPLHSALSPLDADALALQGGGGVILGRGPSQATGYSENQNRISEILQYTGALFGFAVPNWAAFPRSTPYPCQVLTLTSHCRYLGSVDMSVLSPGPAPGPQHFGATITCQRGLRVDGIDESHKSTGACSSLLLRTCCSHEPASGITLGKHVIEGVECSPSTQASCDTAVQLATVSATKSQPGRTSMKACFKV